MKIHTTQQIEFDDGSLSPAVTSTQEIPMPMLFELEMLVRPTPGCYLKEERDANVIVVRQLPVELNFSTLISLDPKINISDVTVFAEMGEILEQYWTPTVRPNNHGTSLFGGTLSLPKDIPWSGSILSFRAVTNQGAMTRKIDYIVDIQTHL